MKVAVKDSTSWFPVRSEGVRWISSLHVLRYKWRQRWITSQPEVRIALQINQNHSRYYCGENAGTHPKGYRRILAKYSRQLRPESLPIKPMCRLRCKILESLSRLASYAVKVTRQKPRYPHFRLSRRPNLPPQTGQTQIGFRRLVSISTLRIDMYLRIHARFRASSGLDRLQ